MKKIKKIQKRLRDSLTDLENGLSELADYVTANLDLESLLGKDSKKVDRIEFELWRACGEIRKCLEESWDD